MGLLLDWFSWWNTRHHPSALNGKTPVEVWQADATPLTDVPARQLATFALEDDGRTYTISTSGVRWRRRDYLAPRMNGRTGTKVSVRHLPHHDDTIELFGTTGHHLGSAFLAAAASREQIRSLKAARTAAARRLKADLKAAEMLRRRRFEASTTAAPPRQPAPRPPCRPKRSWARWRRRTAVCRPVLISFRTAPHPIPGPAPSARAHLPLMGAKLMIADLDYGLLPDESEDHVLGLEQAQLVGTDTLLTTREHRGRHRGEGHDVRLQACRVGQDDAGELRADLGTGTAAIRRTLQHTSAGGLTTPPTKTRAYERRIALREFSSQMT